MQRDCYAVLPIIKLEILTDRKTVRKLSVYVFTSICIYQSLIERQLDERCLAVIDAQRLLFE